MALNAGRNRALRQRTSTAARTSCVAASPAATVACEGYLRIKKRSALTWSTRFLLLRGCNVSVFSSKQDATHRRNVVDSFELATGKISPKMELGMELCTKDKREFQARVFSRADLARWVTAFHRLQVKLELDAASTGMHVRVKSENSCASDPQQQKQDPPRERHSAPTIQEGGEEEINPVVHSGEARKSNERRRVSFHGSVMVRMIPALQQEQVPELFYTKADVEKFSAKATSLFSRTEEAVSCAYLSLRRPALSWRRQVV
uniref:PH domain-containing protein n=1 Tax=Globisporangium ultimum (strain ATCC 200006 / CBS 805.95 / DAOM BR144) TaxID=431595 RepID=K3W670_GLOUD